MANKKLTIKKSKIEGYGLYAAEDIKRGEIIMIWTADAYLIPEHEYIAKLKTNDKQMLATGARYVGSTFLYTDVGPGKDRYDNYINHSFEPNVLYHCGVCFALCDICDGDELTTDYTYLLAEGDVESFYDVNSKRQVYGANAHECLMVTTDKLAKLLQSSKYQTQKKLNTSYTNDVYILDDVPCPAPSSSESDSDLGDL